MIYHWTLKQNAIRKYPVLIYIIEIGGGGSGKKKAIRISKIFKLTLVFHELAKVVLLQGMFFISVRYLFDCFCFI